MIRLFFLALLGSVTFLHAKTVVIKEGGYSVEVPEPISLQTRENYHGMDAENLVFPRIQGKNFFIDSVTWWSSPKDWDMDEVLSGHEKIPGFKAHLKEIPIISRQSFTTANGVQGVRFIQLRTYPDGTKLELHRFIFRNAKQTVICLGIYGDKEAIDKIYASVTLTK